ncbi:hypothetical protein PENCOP_c004G06309 [Penicillium coprophilum]|uniref:Altered inheritance of mitochondria protein 9, mitochondrial n=1 Tax=Penicillium coprophilum TaxID=36646 RepID=A0A1V6UUG1_9EURO|nr:hypothetical protein PENCOP_c004G06309 [Penicillium coprophilum]
MASHLQKDGGLNALECYKVIDEIVKMETELESLKLPATSILDFALSTPYRELAAGDWEEFQRHLNQFGVRQSVDEYFDRLRKAILVLPVLSRDPRVLEGSGSVIWHTDLHLVNILVSSEDLTTVEGVIDWQSAQAAPLFMQAQFPENLRPPRNYSVGTEMLYRRTLKG